MPVVSEAVWEELKSVVNNAPQGLEVIELDRPTVWDPTPFIVWNKADWSGEDGLIQQGWRVVLFKVRQTETVRRPLGLPRTEERNLWLIRYQNPGYPEQVDEKICTLDEVVATFRIDLLECHPK